MRAREGGRGAGEGGNKAGGKGGGQKTKKAEILQTPPYVPTHSQSSALSKVRPTKSVGMVDWQAGD